MDTALDHDGMNRHLSVERQRIEDPTRDRRDRRSRSWRSWLAGGIFVGGVLGLMVAAANLIAPIP